MEEGVLCIPEPLQPNPRVKLNTHMMCVCVWGWVSISESRPVTASWRFPSLSVLSG